MGVLSLSHGLALFTVPHNRKVSPQTSASSPQQTGGAGRTGVRGTGVVVVVGVVVGVGGVITESMGRLGTFFIHPTSEGGRGGVGGGVAGKRGGGKA